MRAKLGISNEEEGDSSLFAGSEFSEWHALWQARLKRQDVTNVSPQALMRITNPSLIPRNHPVEEALERQ